MKRLRYSKRVKLLVQDAFKSELSDLEEVIEEMQLACEHQGYRNALAPKVIIDLSSIAVSRIETSAYEALRLLVYIGYGFPEVDLLLNRKKSLSELGQRLNGDLRVLGDCNQALKTVSPKIQSLLESRSVKVRCAAIYALTWFSLSDADLYKNLNISAFTSDYERLHLFLWQCLVHESVDRTLLRGPEEIVRILGLSIDNDAAPIELVRELSKVPSRDKSLEWFRGELLLLAIFLFVRIRGVDRLAELVSLCGPLMDSYGSNSRAIVLEMILATIFSSDLKSANDTTIAQREIVKEIARLDAFWIAPGGYQILDTIELLNSYGLSGNRSLLLS